MKCVYCGKELEDEQEKSVHIAEEHTETDEKITTKGKSKGRNIVEDEWDAGDEEE